ncbi:MAG: shikimate dehydrogenase [Bacteroidales bacterium]
MKRFGLIGFPLGHSWSARYFSDKFASEGTTDYRYDLFPLKKIEELPQLLSNTPDLAGFNVTIPYKQSVMDYLDELSEPAKKIGAVNCVRVSRTSESSTLLSGYNTDWLGFLEAYGTQLSDFGQKAMILGNGGAARAVAYALQQLEIEPLFVGRHDYNTGNFLYWNEILPGHFKQFRIIINTTPLGMSPDVDSSPPVPYEYLTRNHLVIDLVYNPEETLFIKKAKRYGAVTAGGYPMLTAQAEHSWKIWTQ